METQYYAVTDSTGAVYGVGTSRGAAQGDANDYGADINTTQTLPCTRQVALFVEVNGGAPGYFTVQNGVVCMKAEV